MHYLRPFGWTSPSQHSLRQDPADLLGYALQCVASISDRSLLAIMLSDGLQEPSLHSFLLPLLRKRSSFFSIGLRQNDQREAKWSKLYSKYHKDLCWCVRCNYSPLLDTQLTVWVILKCNYTFTFYINVSFYTLNFYLFYWSLCTILLLIKYIE